MYKILDNYPSVQIDQCVPNTWNPNVQNDFEMSKLLTSIQEFGFMGLENVAIIVTET